MDLLNYYRKLKNNENNNIVKTLGLLASFIGLLRFIPMVYEIYKTKKTNNFTPSMLTLALLSSIFWLIFALYENSIPVLSSSIIALFVYLYIIYMKINY